VGEVLAAQIEHALGEGPGAPSAAARPATLVRRTLAH
jgi:hypothetical protein